MCRLLLPALSQLLIASYTNREDSNTLHNYIIAITKGEKYNENTEETITEKIPKNPFQKFFFKWISYVFSEHILCKKIVSKDITYVSKSLLWKFYSKKLVLNCISCVTIILFQKFRSRNFIPKSCSENLKNSF